MAAARAPHLVLDYGLLVVLHAQVLELGLELGNVELVNRGAARATRRERSKVGRRVARWQGVVLELVVLVAAVEGGVPLARTRQRGMQAVGFVIAEPTAGVRIGGALIALVVR